VISPLLEFDLAVTQYADVSLDFIWTAGGIPVDYTGANARLMIRATVDALSQLVSISTTPGAQGRIVLAGPANPPPGGPPPGGVRVKLAKAGLVFGPGVRPTYTLDIDWPDGTTTALATGSVFVTPSATY
jgi:hypothetical protein